MQSDRAKAADKAAKVFRQGVSTTAVGEKEKCFGLISKLIEKHKLNLSDLDPAFPKTVDPALLRRKLGLTGGGQAAGADDARRAREAAAQREREAAAQRDREAARAKQEREERDRKAREEQERQRREQQARQDQAAGGTDLESLLWHQLIPTQRRQVLDGALLGRSLEGVKGTSAYRRLLADLRTHDLSREGAQLGDAKLVELLDYLLARSGKTISCPHRVQTLFDDLYSASLTSYRTAAVLKQQNDRKAEDEKQRKQKEEKAWKEEKARQEREAQERAREQQRRAEVSSDPEVMLFQHLSAEQRKKVMHGPLFSRGIMSQVQGTSAYGRLLAELSHLDTSTSGVQLGDRELLSWLTGVLGRQGSTVQPKHGSNTIFDDILAHCRFTYAQRAEQVRQERARQKAEEAKQKAADDAKRRAAAAGSGQSSYGRHGTGSSYREAYQEPKFIKSFDDMQEARLYLHLARLHLGGQNGVRSYSKYDKWHVELTTTAGVRDDVDLAFRRALHEVQFQAMNNRVEAARERDEAIRQANEEYERLSARAFRSAVDAYVT
ncbi:MULTISPECIES: hypothetical protein [unclassified Deinococcus]|uniref:hypothetical protein n=1 Tax=unclassified Deinococcus TaxID=2623546 RepID=UPI001C30E4FE|nr:MULTISPECIES: hypothetical protein [unclassified Deinococcus]MDK2011871.1 hypothetical protein [Deinococcus sp. 43]